MALLRLSTGREPPRTTLTGMATRKRKPARWTLSEQLALQIPEEQPEVAWAGIFRAGDRGMQTLRRRAAAWIGPRIAYLRANAQPVTGLTLRLAPVSENAA